MDVKERELAEYDVGRPIWPQFCQAAAWVLTAPLADATAQRLAPFGAWIEGVVRALVESAPGPITPLFAAELSAFVLYVARLRRTAIAEGPRPLDASEARESCSILGTILDSLKEIFPGFKELWQMGKEAVDIRGAVAKGNHR